MKNNIEYYKHYTNSHNHWKFKKLRRKYGFAGEGKFWALNNHIADSENCKFDLSNSNKMETIAIDLDFDIEEFKDFILYLVKDCKLVKQDDNEFYYTEDVQEVLLEVMKKRERDRKLKNEKSLTKNEKSLTKYNNSSEKEGNSYNEKQQSKVKESKVDVVVELPTPTTTPDEVKKMLLLDIGLLNCWIEKGFPKEKFEHGVETFVNQALKDVYEKKDTPKRHFINWLPNYPKASQTTLPEINGIQQPKLSFKR